MDNKNRITRGNANIDRELAKAEVFLSKLTGAGAVGALVTAAKAGCDVVTAAPVFDMWGTVALVTFGALSGVLSMVSRAAAREADALRNEPSATTAHSPVQVLTNQ